MLDFFMAVSSYHAVLPCSYLFPFLSSPIYQVSLLIHLPPSPNTVSPSAFTTHAFGFFNPLFLKIPSHGSQFFPPTLTLLGCIVYAWKRVPVFICMWRSEVNTGYPHQSLFTLFAETVYWMWGSLIRLGWLAKELQAPSFVWTPVLELQMCNLVTRLLFTDSWKSEIKSTWLCDRFFENWSISQPLRFSYLLLLTIHSNIYMDIYI